MWAVNPNRAFSTLEYSNVLRLDEATGGGMVLVKSLGEILTESGKRLAVESSSLSGQSLLPNPRAPKGGVVVPSGRGSKHLQVRTKSVRRCVPLYFASGIIQNYELKPDRGL